MYMMGQQKSWEEFLPLVEITYNNSYQSTIKMAPLKFLYGLPCQMPLSWDRLEDRVLVGLEAIQEMEEKIQSIIQRIKEVHDQHKSYVDVHRSTLVMRLVIESSCRLNHIRVQLSLERELKYLLGSWDLSRSWKERGPWPID
jgi:hypothetical protein